MPKRTQPRDDFRMIIRDIDEDSTEHEQRFYQAIERVENNTLRSALISLAQDAPFYRKNPARLLPYVGLYILDLQDKENEDEVFHARYVVQRLDCSNLEPIYATVVLRFHYNDKKDTLDVEIQDNHMAEGWYPVYDDEHEILFEEAYGREAQVEMLERRPDPEVLSELDDSLTEAAA